LWCRAVPARLPRYGGIQIVQAVMQELLLLLIITIVVCHDAADGDCIDVIDV